MQNTSFNHSVKVPKLYKCAAKISQEVAGGGGSIKQLVYEKKHFNTKALYALVVTTFQKSKDIDLLLKRTKLLEKESRLDPWLAKILISELLWGKKQLPESNAKPIQTILTYEQAFHAHLSDSSGDSTSVKTENHKKPRYVRVNTLINPFNEALELFQDEGWILQTPKDQHNYESFLEQVSNLEGDFMLKDLHLPDLLIFPGGTEFYNHPGYKKGAIVLQDKASCIPVHLLSPSPGSVVLDMCAAPGMKTTQLAMMLENEGTVYAVERDQKRFEVLNKMVESSGATCIKTINEDVLQCNGSDFPDVEYVLVDPSCSASGMTDRLELQQNRDPLRLQKLAGFQIKILRSALTRYPKVKKVVYSTCSLYPEENEDVVRQVLETNNEFKLVPAANFINNAWKNFGSPDFGDIGKYCLYARPEEDKTNGFFVAVFEKLEEGENNQFFNGRVMNYRKNVEKRQARKERKFKGNMEGGDGFENSEGQRGKGRKMSGIGLKVDDGNFHEDVIDEDVSSLKKKSKRKHVGEVDTQDQCLGGEMINEFPQKQKKNRRKHEDENITKTDEENKELNNDDVAITNETFKKSKKKKREDYEEADGHKQTDENMDKSLSNDKKKKRKHVELENLELSSYENEKLINRVWNSDRDLADQKDTLLKKRNKKKNKHGELVNLAQTIKETQKIINKVPRQDVENTNQNLVGEIIDKTFKKSKKKKRKEGEEENMNTTYKGNIELIDLTKDSDNINEDVADQTITESVKRSKKKNQKPTGDGNLTYTEEEYEGQTNEDSRKSKKKKQKHSALDDTT